MSYSEDIAPIRRSLNLVLITDRANPLWKDAADALAALEQLEVRLSEQARDRYLLRQSKERLEGQVSRLTSALTPFVDALRDVRSDPAPTGAYRIYVPTPAILTARAVLDAVTNPEGSPE